MKTIITLLAALAFGVTSGRAQVPPLRAATPAEVLAGTSRTTAVTPFSLSTSGITDPSNGVTPAGATNIAQAISATNNTTGNAATATLVTGNGTVISTNFVGNGAGLTNLAAAMVDQGTGIVLTNTIKKALSGGAIVGLWYGDSIGDDTYYQTVHDSKSLFSAGVSRAAFRSVDTLNYWRDSVNSGFSTESDVYWNAFYSVNSGLTNVWYGNLDTYAAMNQVQYCYLRDSGLGTAAIDISSDNVNWTHIATVDQSGTRGLAFTNITVTRGNYIVRQRVSVSAVKYLWLGGVDTTSQAARLSLANADGKSLADFIAQPDATFAVLLTNLNPDFIVYQQTKNVWSYTNFPAAIAKLRAYAPRADIILVSPHRIHPSHEVFDPTEVAAWNDGLSQVRAGRAHAQTNGLHYVDIWSNDSWTNVVLNGYDLDTVHYNDAGMAWTARKWEAAVGWPAIGAVSSAIGRFNTTNLNTYFDFNVNTPYSGYIFPTYTVSSNAARWYLKDPVASSHAILSNAWSVTRMGLYLGQSAPTMANIAGDSANTKISGTGGIIFGTADRGDGFAGINGQMYASGGMSLYPASPTSYDYKDPGQGVYQGAGLSLIQHTFGGSFPTNYIPGENAGVTNAVWLMWKGRPYIVATNRADGGLMRWRTTDETWQSFTP